MEIHVLKAQGLSERQIARKLGISRNTVARYLDAPEAPRYKLRQARPTKLDAFKTYIARRIAEAHPEWIPAPAMLRELQALGYVGQVRQLQAFMRSCKPAAKDDPVVRFETPPGQQLQCDFVVFRRGRHPLYAFTATLGHSHSRWRWVRFTADETADTLVACHHALFASLGGVPKEILYDNAKSVVIKRDLYGPGQHRWNDDFLVQALSGTYQGQGRTVPSLPARQLLRAPGQPDEGQRPAGRCADRQRRRRQMAAGCGQPARASAHRSCAHYTV